MTFHLQKAGPAGPGAPASPYRVVSEPGGQEIGWVNRFLDRECVRGLGELTIRSYAFALMGFVRWWFQTHAEITPSGLSEVLLVDFIRYQSGLQPRPAAATINGRVGVVERALAMEYPQDTLGPAGGWQRPHWRRSPLGFGRARPALTKIRVKMPRRVAAPLSVDQVARFWGSFRTARDLALVGLMLFHGLRSREVLALDSGDALRAEAQMPVRGKGQKMRLLPLAPETVTLLEHYLRGERPPHCGPALFVSLKGRARGCRMTVAGLRSLFRHHRRIAGVEQANPHRFRHTFATDMIRAGVSLPALMQLMGHAQIHTTLVYVQLTPQDVYREYARAVAQHIRPLPATPQP